MIQEMTLDDDDSSFRDETSDEETNYKDNVNDVQLQSNQMCQAKADVYVNCKYDCYPLPFLMDICNNVL